MLKSPTIAEKSVPSSARPETISRRSPEWLLVSLTTDEVKKMTIQLGQNMGTIGNSYYLISTKSYTSIGTEY